MPLLASNFTSNTLSGTVRVSGGAANIGFAIEPFAFEGSKTFVVKLRRGSVTGDILSTSNPITINDYSQIISLTANVSTVAEGNLVSLSLVTANVPNNANVFYSIFPVTANVTASDFYGSNSGILTINNNQATFSLFANVDAGYVSEDGETFKVQLRTNGTTGNIVYTSANIAVTDFFRLFNALSLVESSSSVAEGVAVTFTFIGHNIPTGTLLYYDTVGNVTSFTANTGSFAMNGLSNTISITATNIPAGETLDYRLRVRKNSADGEIIRTSNIINVIDGAITYTTVSGISGNVIVANGYTTHAFTSSNTLTFTGISGAPERNTVEYMVVAGGGAGGYQTGGGAGGMITGQFELTSANLGTYTIQVGTGGSGAGLAGGSGNPSYIQNTGNTIHLSAMGGGGAAWPGISSVPGGSGGGGGPTSSSGIPGQGNAGTSGSVGAGGGAGGAASGSNGGIGRIANVASFTNYGQLSGSDRYFAGGGGGNTGPSAGTGGLGGGARGTPSGGGFSGNVNTGGGGGSGTSDQPSSNWGGSGGSGIVIIRYISSAYYSRVVESASSLVPYPTTGNITFSVSSVGANGIPLYYTTTGNATVNDFVSGNTGSFIITGPTSNVTLVANAFLAGATKNFQLQLRTGSTSGPVVLTSNTVILNGYSDYIEATGGLVFTQGGYRTHIFTSSNNFAITSLPGTANIEIMVVAGGGSAANPSNNPTSQAGGGAGGVLVSNAAVSTGSYTITVGAGGGAGSVTNGTPGANSIVSGAGISLTAVGGGFGGGNFVYSRNGGSGGGSDGNGGVAGVGYPGQGYPGGSNGPTYGSGGGGAGMAGGGYYPGSGPVSPLVGTGTGGDGIAAPMSPTIPGSYGTGGPAPGRYFGGGGAGNNQNPTQFLGGAGGGGNGRYPGNSIGTEGLINTGGGAGAANAMGGSGIVIIRYPYLPNNIDAIGGNVSVSGGYKTHIFTDANTFTLISAAKTTANSTIEYMVVGGGGGGGAYRSGFFGQGGGGAGGFVRGNLVVSSSNVYSITVGGGGAGAIRDPASPTYYGVNTPAASGTNSTFANTSANVNIVARGGGAWNTSGGSGGGNGAAGFGYPSPTQHGYPGGPTSGSAGAGGGAGQAGQANGTGGMGRNFDTPTFWGDPGPEPGRYFAGGGGAGNPSPIGAGGIGGGGQAVLNLAGKAGNVFTGGGGAGAFDGPGNGGAGGSGIIVIRYPYN